MSHRARKMMKSIIGNFAVAEDMFLDEVAAIAVAEAAAKAAEPITDGRSTSSSHKGCRGQNSTTSMSVDAVVEDKPKGESTVKAASKGRGRGGKGEARGTTPTTAKKPEKRGSEALDGLNKCRYCGAEHPDHQGHLCPSLSRWTQTCWFCGLERPGHLGRDCPMNPKNHACPKRTKVQVDAPSKDGPSQSTDTHFLDVNAYGFPI